MKVCNSCGETKELDCFRKGKGYAGGYKPSCKECLSIEAKIHFRTIVGRLREIYKSQKRLSIKRNHSLPVYTRQELIDRYAVDKEYLDLHSAWVESGYEKMLSPSLDRIDNSKSYSFDNLQVMTWQENKNNGHRDMRNGKISTGMKRRPVSQFTRAGKWLALYFSIRTAAREIGGSATKIVKVCKGKSFTHKGFIWRYAESTTYNNKGELI